MLRIYFIKFSSIILHKIEMHISTQMEGRQNGLENFSKTIAE